MSDRSRLNPKGTEPISQRFHWVLTKTETSAMTTPKSVRSNDSQAAAKRPPIVDDEDIESTDDIDDTRGLHELSFDDDSRSDRHSAIGSEQAAQSDNAPDENVDELDDGNDIGEQDEE